MQGGGNIHPQQQTQEVRLVMTTSYTTTSQGLKLSLRLEPEPGLVGACVALADAPCLAQVRRGRVVCFSDDYNLSMLSVQ